MEKTALYYVKKRTLLALAGSVWLIAGFNVSKLGLRSFSLLKQSSLILILLTVLVFIAFGLLFYKLANKHSKRIASYADTRKPIWNFFDLKSYLIMFFMMGGGIWLRSSGLVPNDFIAFFYTGLGLALALAGVLFWIFYFKYQE